MVADISHELRTPITVIRGEIEALMDGIRQASPAAFESLHAEVLHLNKLVDDLHQLTLADAGALSFHWRTVDLRDVLEPVLARYRLRAASAGLTLRVSLPPDPLPLDADADRLTQVLVNLLENCVRYTDNGGQISVAAPRAGARALLTIEDSTPGVPADALAHLFDRLYRVDSARTRERGGSGLGLAICKAFIEAHGGGIKAAPSPLGGLRMTIDLPLKEQ
jgi:two-component system sensor histidine kinase BaeS